VEAVEHHCSERLRPRLNGIHLQQHQQQQQSFPRPWRCPPACLTVTAGSIAISSQANSCTRAFPLITRPQ
jgi:hypothetical protein